MKQTKIMRTYYTNGIATFMKAEGGFLAVYDDEGNYSWGEFISDKDFNSDSFDQVEYEEADFTNQDAYYQRGMTEEIALIHQEKPSIIPNHERTMNTDTPETNANAGHICYVGEFAGPTNIGEFVRSDFARKLERERDEARQAARERQYKDSQRLDWLQSNQKTVWRVSHEERRLTTMLIPATTTVQVFDGWTVDDEENPKQTIREAIDQAMNPPTSENV